MLRVAAASPADAPLVHSIMRQAFAEYEAVLQPPSGGTRETVDDVARAMRAGGAALVWDGETAVASARYERLGDRLYVGRVAVLPAHRRRGIASLLMAWIEQHAREQGVEMIEVGVRMSLPYNLALYQKLGYELIRVEPHPRGLDRVGTLIKRLI